jgi:hypothetical protein
MLISAVRSVGGGDMSCNILGVWMEVITKGAVYRLLYGSFVGDMR